MTNNNLNAKILIVDDQEANIDILEGFLSIQGYTNLKSLKDPRDVISNIKSFNPDIILLDLSMPHLTGFDVMEQLKSVISASDYLPILVLTADVAKETKQNALSSGANDFLTKPFDLIEVGLRIKNLLYTRYLYKQLQGQNQLLEERVKERTHELEETNKNLIIAKDKAEENDKLKTAFLQNLSHEIRTPMNAIVGFSELMELEIDNPEKLKEYIDTIKIRSNDLLNIIIELLDIAKIDSGQLKVNIGTVNISTLINDVFSEFLSHPLKLEKNSITLSITKLPSYLNPLVESDTGKIKQIFINLIHNALKFTQEGNVKFGYYDFKEDYITFYVSDTGQGIPDNMRDLIFERFRKSANELAYVQDGIGLGLAIVKGLLNIFGGKIWLESEENKGSTFYFKIPYKPSSSNSQIEQRGNQIYDWSRYQILIVEDDPFNISLFREILKSTQVDCLFAKTGREAITTFNSTNKLDLVLMDIKLPDISGYHVTSELKKVNPNIIILAQTAYASDVDKQKIIAAGCSGFISKPIKRDILLKTIDNYLK
ncbi:MAG: response regulator [Bacteroidales bacterium]